MRKTRDSFDMLYELAFRLKPKHGQLYMFGGYMRDTQLGKKAKSISDIDIRVVGISKEEFLNILAEIAKKYNTKPYIIEGRFEIIKLEGFDIDFSSPENEDGTIKTFDDIKKSADFTINSFFRNVRKSKIIDEDGGMDDLAKKCIRLVNPEIIEPFLAIRAAKLRSKLARKHDKIGRIIWDEIDNEWQIDDSSREVMLGYDYTDFNYQRLRDVLKKIMVNPEYVQSVFFRELLTLGVLESVLSPLEQLSGLQVDVNGRKMNAFEHTMRMLDCLSHLKSDFLFKGNYEERKLDFENFESIYMMCLTYYFRNMYRGSTEIGREIRKFLTKIVIPKKTKITTGYYLNNEDTLVRIYNNFYNMSSEMLAREYAKHREKLESIGYFVESYNLAGIDNPTSQEYAECKKRLSDWKSCMKRAKEMSNIVVRRPKIGIGTRTRYTLSMYREMYGDSCSEGTLSLTQIGEFTQHISPQAVCDLFGARNTNRGRTTGSGIFR